MSAPAFALLLVILSFGAFVQAVSGFGFALVAVPLASIVVAPSRAVVIISLASLLTSVRNTLAARGHIERPVAGRMIAYNWFDCDKQPQPRAVNVFAGCVVPPAAGER